jgi:phosphate/sulfate permease
MTGLEWTLIVLVMVVGFYVAWSIGANDVANAMGTAVGSRSLTLKQAVIIAGIFEFVGAYLVGANVADTVRKKLFDPMLLTDLYSSADFGEGYSALILACGMIAALIAAGTWLVVASYFGLPVSTSHSIVGAVVGFGCVAVGASAVDWGTVGLITLGWIISPVLSGAVAYILFRFVLRSVFYKRDPVAAAKRVTPYLAGCVVAVLVAIAAFKGLQPFWEGRGVDPTETHMLVMFGAVSLLAGMVGMFVARRLVRRIPNPQTPDAIADVITPDVSRSLSKARMHLRRVRDVAGGSMSARATQLLDPLDELISEARSQVEFGTDSPQLQQVERIFAYLQVLTACFVAFSHGSNDVANAIGPLSAAYQAVRSGEVVMKSPVPAWALALGGVGIVAGLATWGWRVIRTIGERITELTPSRGFTASFSAALVILLASILPLGLPISTTHTVVGALLGVGLARGFGSLNTSVIKNIVASWIVTVPVGAMLAIIFFYFLKFLFIDCWYLFIINA